jgi:hypothetical protein
MAINTWPWLKNVQNFQLESMCNNTAFWVAWGLETAVDNFFHICVGLFGSISKWVQDGIEADYVTEVP